MKTNVRSIIEGIDLSGISRHFKEKANISEAETQDIERQYRDFLTVAAESGELVVPSEPVDQFWHLHILDTDKYMSDCDKIFGGYFHHDPNYFGTPEFYETFNRTQTKLADLQTHEATIDQFLTSLYPASGHAERNHQNKVVQLNPANCSGGMKQSPQAANCSGGMKQNPRAANCSGGMKHNPRAANCSGGMKHNPQAANCSGGMKQNPRAANCSGGMKQSPQAANCSGGMKTQFQYNKRVA